MQQEVQTPQLPNVTDAGSLINASGSDWRAFLIAVMFLFVSMIVFVVWREILNWKLAKSLDKVAEALVALRLAVVENAAEARGRHHGGVARQEPNEVQRP
jgi:hypothetical protein